MTLQKWPESFEEQKALLDSGKFDESFDPFFRRDNFGGFPWYNEFCLFQAIGVCTVRPGDEATLFSALRKMGYSPRKREMGGSAMLSPSDALQIGSSRISFSGTKAEVGSAKSVLDSLSLTGSEETDRLLIQQAVDWNKLKAGILYNGNTVLPFASTVKAYRRLQASGDLTKMTKQMYHFFIYQCGDIALPMTG